MSKILVTGGAGFIGSNLVHHLVEGGHDVTILDDLSRHGAETNLAWLQSIHGKRLHFVKADIRDAAAVQRAAENTQRIYHLAGQVAVTTSVVNPRDDFEINALGTFNVLEAARLAAENPIFVYASTNKVYGGMEGVTVEETESRYRYRDYPAGIPETFSPGFSLSVWVLQGVRRPVRARLCANLWATHAGLSPELYLWPAPVRSRGSGVGGIPIDRRVDGLADQYLRGRQAGARRVDGRRSDPCLRDGG